jgi:hypothetical protein
MIVARPRPLVRAMLPAKRIVAPGTGSVTPATTTVARNRKRIRRPATTDLGRTVRRILAGLHGDALVSAWIDPSV